VINLKQPFPLSGVFRKTLILSVFLPMIRYLVAGIIFLLVCVTHGAAQLTVTEGAAMNLTPQQLVQQWLVGQGITVTNATYNGSSALITSTQIGTFIAAGPAQAQLGIADGVLMTSGKASIAIGPNTSSGAGFNSNGTGDPDLNMIAAPLVTYDKCILEFDFVPMYDTVRFHYVFASEEFYNFCNSSFNDVFGFFLSGPGISGPYSNNAINIALMPYSSNPVTINNVCNDNTSNWCNEPGNPTPYQNCSEASGVYFQYDALTWVFTAWHIVVPCSTYHIKLAIGDTGDHSLDSGVFLEKNSFSSIGLTLQNTFSLPSLGNRAIEGCSNATVSFLLPYPTPTPYTINYTIGGTATNGVDYAPIANSITIPAGQDSGAVVIIPYFDGIPEGIETVILGISQPSCTGGNVLYDTIFIHDNSFLNAFAGADDTICWKDTVTLSASATGGITPYSYLWNVPGGNTQTVKVVPSTPGDFTYIIIITDGCGQVDRDTILVHVKQLPLLLNNPARDTVCSGQTTNIVLQSTLPATTYTWTAQCISGVVTGMGPGSGPIIMQQLHNLSAVMDSVLYSITPYADGCTGPDSVFKVLVKPLPRVNFVQPWSAVCSGQTTDVQTAPPVAGSQITWTASATSPNISGYSNGSGNSINQTLLNFENEPDSVIYIALATAMGCIGPPDTHYVVVNPVPVLILAPMFDSICSGDFTNIILNSTCPGTSFDWIASPGIGSISGASNGTGGLITQQLYNLLNTTGSVTYSITPYTTSCAGADSLYTVWVYPEPHLINNPLRDTLCYGGNTATTLLSDVTGTGFTWTCTQTSGMVAGWSNNTIPTTQLDQALVNNSYQIDSVVYHITPHANGCDGTDTSFTFLVYPRPDVIIIPTSQTLCSGQTTGLSLQSNVAGTSFSWTTGSNPGVSGNHNGSGTIISDTLFNTTLLIQQIIYTVTPTAFGCPAGIPQTGIVTVNPEPEIINTQRTFSQCSQSTTNIVFQSNLTYPMSYSWIAAGSSSFITGYSSGSGPAIAQTLVNSGDTIETVYYYVVPSALGCNGDTVQFTVIVYPVADAIITPPTQSICSGTNCALSLTSGVNGAAFSWTAAGSSPGLSGFLPGNGNQINQMLFTSEFIPGTVTYTVTPSIGGCPGTVSIATVTVRPAPSVSFTLCFDSITLTAAQPVLLKGGIPRSGVYTGSGISGGIFYPGVAGPGTHTLTYSYTNTFGCTGSSNRFIVVQIPVPFTCGENFTDIRDATIYPTVQIGAQCWMASNLNYGNPLPSSQHQRDNCILEKYCFKDLPELCALGSVLYQWDELMQYSDNEGVQGICPPGWHVPTESEWQVLFTGFPPYNAGGAGSPLKSSGFSGFNAFPEGMRFNNSVWKFTSSDPVLRSTMFWSSTPAGNRKAIAHGLSEVVADNAFTPSVSLYRSSRNNAFSLRCLKD
jgi:uncharacterized protein (TIGR02145 family)